MINNILNALFGIVFYILDFFLAPIYDALADVDLGGTTFADAIAQLNDYMLLLRQTLGWVADATGIPGWLFTLMGTFLLTNITARISIYIIKLIVKWWHKIIP